MKEILQNFANVKVLVVGDVMLDRYWWGSVERISPEAPVPIVNLAKESFVVGGAANVAANVKGLGSKVFLVGIIGDDFNGQKLSESLAETDIDAENLIVIEKRPTTVKTRIIAHQQQVARIDEETKENLSERDEEIIVQKLKVILEQIDIVVVSDYAKGLISNSLAESLIKLASELGKKVLVDPKGNNYTKYRNATLLTPNRKEAFEALSGDFGSKDVNETGKRLMSELDLESLLITQGEDGMTIFERDKKPTHLDALARHVYDVTGAGDTVIATLAVAIAAGANLTNAAKLANIAAGYVVGEVGTTAITFAGLSGEIATK